MIICFTETEKDSERFFEEHLQDHAIGFFTDLEDIPGEAECLSIFINARITREFLENHGQLRLIATRSTGVDHIDLAACNERNIVVSYVPTYGENTVAEHAFALLLAISRRIRQALTVKRRGQFSFEAFRGFDLKDKTIGVVGAGRIGLHVIRIAKAFGMQVIATDPNPSSLLSELLGFEYVSFDQLLQRSHVISLHAPFTPSTLHLFNQETFAKCRRGVILINTARGSLIKTEALLEALDSGLVAGAGLDVLEDERLFRMEGSRLMADRIIENLQHISSPEEMHIRNPERLAEIQRLAENESLLSRPNVVFTPHIAFNSVEAVQRINEVTVQNIIAFAAGTPINVVIGKGPTA